MKFSIAHLAHLQSCIVKSIDQCPDITITTTEVYQAINDWKIVDLLQDKYPRLHHDDLLCYHLDDIDIIFCWQSWSHDQDTWVRKEENGHLLLLAITSRLINDWLSYPPLYEEQKLSYQELFR